MHIPKIKIDLFPTDTRASQRIEISVLKIAWWVFLFLFIVGSSTWIFLHPEVFHDFLGKKPGKLRAQNQEFSSHIREVKTSIDSVRKKIDSLELAQAKISGLLGEGQNLLDSSIYQFPRWKDISAHEISAIVDSITEESGPIFDSLFMNSAQTATLPLGHPMGYMVKASATYGMRLDPFTGRKLPHLGVDFSCIMGDTIYSPGKGIVSAVGRDRGFGLIIKVDHGRGVESTYAHLEKALKQKNQSVKRMTPLAICGQSGRSTGPHLHYEISVDDNTIDPLRILELYESDMRVLLKPKDTKKKEGHHE